jgi:NADH dehydrogenase (ubiquinone) 1 alpha subcomplex subunit 5
MERAALVKSETNVAELEKKINCGQIEEILIQASNELKLSRKILEWKSWEQLTTQPPATQWKWPI